MSGDLLFGRVTEARKTSRTVEGDLTFRDREELLRTAITDQFGPDGDGYCYCWVRDLSDEWVAYELEADGECATYKVSYSIDEASNTVTFAGDPEKVILKTSYEQIGQTSEAHERIAGRVIEARSDAADGGRVFGVQIIAAGTSRNGVRYTESVLTAAAAKYEGAKAFDHHRTEAELRSSTIAGLAGHYRNVEASSSGLFADLHLLPSATHVAEALDASLAAQASGLAPVVGISHDVEMLYTPVIDGGRRIKEATAITSVLSADVVADPSAGGRVTRMVAGGNGTNDTNDDLEVTVNFKQLMALLQKATPEERAELLKEHAEVLTTAGYAADDVPTLLGEDTSTETETTDELVGAAAEGGRGRDSGVDTYGKTSAVGRMVIREAVSSAGLPDGIIGAVTEALPERFSEADAATAVQSTLRLAESLELTGMGPRIPHLQVGEEDLDKRKAKLDATFAGDWQNGYLRISEAFLDITGQRQRAFDPDLAAEIVRESWGGPMVGGSRVTESLTTTSWGEVLADALNKRLLALYRGSNLRDWEKIVDVAPVLDFRSQKLIRTGGYGVLPTVNEGAPYQALTSPGDEQVTYTPTKKGGTEDYTYEMAKNDDLRQLVNIPTKLAKAAAQTLHRFVWDFLTANAAMDYDSVALFHASHANTGTGALSESTLDTARQKMRDQAAYGDTYDVLGLIPKWLVVPNELERIATQLCKSTVSIPSSGNASDIPNIHNGMEPIVVDYWTDANDWFVIADKADAPFIEVGFLDGKKEPELFVQDDPATGSVFSADKVTWKIRHIYGGDVVDHRPAQRTTN